MKEMNIEIEVIAINKFLSILEFIMSSPICANGIHKINMREANHLIP